MNPAVRTVQAFTPGVGDHDFKPASSPGGASRVFVWGRPGFIGVGTAGRDLELYFAWTDLPRGNEQSWSPHYFAGLDEQGQPRFSERETEAARITSYNVCYTKLLRLADGQRQRMQARPGAPCKDNPFLSLLRH